MGIFKKIFGSKNDQEPAQERDQEMKQENIEETPQENTQEDSQINESKKGDKIDFQTVVDKGFIRLEAAYRFQPLVLRRCTDEDRITLSEVLNELFQTRKEELCSLSVIARNTFNNNIETERIDDVEKISTFDLFGCILKNKVDGHYTLGMSNDATLIVGCKDRNIYVNISALGGGGGPNYSNKYIRVTVCLPDISNHDNLRTAHHKENWPTVASFIMSFIEGDFKESLAFFEEIEKRAMAKENAGERCDDIEEEYFHGKFQFTGYQYVGYGRWLYEEKRYFDAIETLTRAYKFMRPTIHRESQDIQMVFRDVCQILGDCLTELNRFEEAAFYYKTAIYYSHESGVPSFLSYLKTIAKLGDIKAYGLASDLVHDLCAPKYGEIEDNWPLEQKEIKYEVARILYDYNQKCNIQLHQNSSVNGSITIGDLLKMLMNIDRCNFLPNLAIFSNYDNRLKKTVEDKDAICDYVINNESSQDKSFVLSVSHFHHNTNNGDNSILCILATLIIITHRINQADGGNLMRVDIMRANFPQNDDRRDPEIVNLPFHSSVVLGVDPDETFNTSSSEEFYKCIGFADYLKEQFRFVEAAKYHKWAFENILHAMKNDIGLYENSDEGLLKWYYFAAYRLGFCLLELEQFEKAAYYLDVAQPAGFFEVIQENINCIVNSKSPLALNAVETAISHAREAQNEEHVNEWRQYMAFLKRRKAYVLIDMREFDEAKTYLTEIATDPLCRDFALSELNYLEQNH